MSWEQFQSIVAEAAAYLRDEKTQPPAACPHDGEPLDAGPDGSLHCKLGNYLWPRDRRII